MIDLTNRNTMIATLPHHGRVVEVGVELGLFSQKIMANNEPRQLYLVDAWAHQPGTDWEKLDPCATLDLESNCQHVRNLFKDEPRVNVVRAFSLDAADIFENESLDIVYLDADHTRAYEDILAWWPKIKPSGYLCGHDYTDGLFAWVTVKRDVDCWIAETGYRLQLTNEAWPTWLVQK
jgi:hypothetical protein